VVVSVERMADNEMASEQEGNAGDDRMDEHMESCEMEDSSV
jgi:hypothetical protein